MDYLEVIRKIIEYHRVMRGQLRKAGQAVPDRMAMFDLARQSPRWLPGRPEMVVERQKELAATLDLLHNGLQKHFSFEEQYLPGLWGETLTRALLRDHGRIRTELANLITTVASIKLEELLPGKLDREELQREVPLYLDQLRSRQAHIHDRVGALREMLEDHARREEVVLKWLEKVLEEEKLAGKAPQ